jgi:hypothetical protein
MFPTTKRAVVQYKRRTYSLDFVVNTNALVVGIITPAETRSEYRTVPGAIESASAYASP